MALIEPMNQITHSSSKRKPTNLVSFIRHNLVAILATAIDFLVLILLTELLNIWYVISTIIAAITGAITAFLLGRYWVFVAFETKVQNQAFRYLIVAIGSIILNSLGVYFFTDIVEIQYVISKAITALLVGIGYNYFLSRYFVFK